MMQEHLNIKQEYSEMLDSLKKLQNHHTNLLDNIWGKAENQPNNNCLQNISPSYSSYFEEALTKPKSLDFLSPFPKYEVFEEETLKEEVSLIPNSGKQKRKAGKIFSAVMFYGILISVILGAFLVSRGEKDTVFGYSFMNVLTWSMQSEIPQGSMVIVKQSDPNKIKIGDDITYMKDAETFVTHRVIGITENYEDSGMRGFETQGVDNETPDFELIHAANVIGKVEFHIPMVGGWLNWLRENFIMVLLFSAGVILFVLFIIGALKKEPKENKAKASKRSMKYSQKAF